MGVRIWESGYGRLDMGHPDEWSLSVFDMHQ